MHFEPWEEAYAALDTDVATSCSTTISSTSINTDTKGAAPGGRLSAAEGQPTTTIPTSERNHAIYQKKPSRKKPSTIVINKNPIRVFFLFIMKIRLIVFFPLFGLMKLFSFDFDFFHCLAAFQTGKTKSLTNFLSGFLLNFLSFLETFFVS
jgi:hypothetical protein